MTYGQVRRYFGGGAPIAGRIRVVDGRFADDNGYVGIYGISEFSAIHKVLTGDHGDIERRFDRASVNRRNVARVFAMAYNLFQLSPRQQGYWTALDKVRTLGEQRGLHLELCMFPDSQHVMPDHDDRRAFVRDVAAYVRTYASIIGQNANEAGLNGFESETDPKLLELADLFAAEVGGGVSFSVGDPADIVDDEDTGEPLTSKFITLAEHSDTLVLHGDRTEDPSRYARWVDHLKGITDFRGRVRPGVGFWHDEPKGMAGVKDVPLGNGKTYRREDRPEALVAATCCSAIFQVAFTTHYISEQDDRIPGLEDSALAAAIPQRPDMQFINAAIGGSPVVAFTGFEKVRPCTDGREAWACAYGHQKGTITWDQGFTPERLFNGTNVEVWRATR